MFFKIFPIKVYTLLHAFAPIFVTRSCFRIKKLNIRSSLALSDYCISFQAEIMAIRIWVFTSNNCDYLIRRILRHPVFSDKTCLVQYDMRKIHTFVRLSRRFRKTNQELQLQRGITHIGVATAHYIILI